MLKLKWIVVIDFSFCFVLNFGIIPAFLMVATLHFHFSIIKNYLSVKYCQSKSLEVILSVPYSLCHSVVSFFNLATNVLRL